MRENCSSGSVGERGGNEPLYPESSGTWNFVLWNYLGFGAWDLGFFEALGHGVPCPEYHILHVM